MNDPFELKDLLKSCCLGALCCLCSCECWHDYPYIVRNTTPWEITVRYTSYYNTDSVMIGGGEEDTVFISGQGPERCNGPYEHDVTDDLGSFSLSVGDSLFSRRNFLDNDTWFYHDGTYRTYVAGSDF
jgi:hypothetical protein